MDQYLVTKTLWDAVKLWSDGNGYDYGAASFGKAATHPVQSVTWYDVVKWCNARSEKDGLMPVYYTDPVLTQVYKAGTVDPYVNWRASGYRLPTEAEWEKAARGGASGHRYPWANVETISQSQANYYSDSDSQFVYDISPTRGFHPSFNDGVYPYTSPVGYFAPNAYALYDMTGNLDEWCWDWQGSYINAYETDPRGPGSGTRRVIRGGSWASTANWIRCADRKSGSPGTATNALGFRCARGN